MAPTPTIRLFDAEQARETQLPVHSLAKGTADIRALFDQAGAFGAFVLEGMLLQSLKLGGHAGLRLLGPGDVLSLTQAPRSSLVIESTCRASVPTRLALLDRDMLVAIRRWPQIAAGLHAHTGEQAERLVTQMMICQLPRVDERLLALMWLLAESWGQVTPSGTLLPISLTHAALGGLIGARRPTVTLALGNLTSAGLIRRQPRGWLLLGSPDELARAGSAHRSLITRNNGS
jgi:CRP-like cAMP-binding protein